MPVDQKPTITDEELAARVACEEWVRAKGRLAKAELKLEQAAGGNWMGADKAVDLVQRLKEAQDQHDQCEKGMQSGKPALSGEALKERIEEAKARHAQWLENVATRDRSESWYRQQQQDAERRQLQLETEQAAMNLNRSVSPAVVTQPAEPASTQQRAATGVPKAAQAPPKPAAPAVPPRPVPPRPVPPAPPRPGEPPKPGEKR